MEKQVKHSQNILKIDENGVPGPIRDEVGARTPKKHETVKRLSLDIWIISGTFRHLLRRRFFMFFWYAPLSPPGPLLGALSPGKGAKRSSKMNKNAI